MKLFEFLRRSRPERDVEIHLYALCWNEERMLPYFFRHYDSLVSRYFIFDNGSTDRSIEMLKLNPKVTLGSFKVEGDSFVIAALNHYNECWKQSRGQADWVIVCNIDEHIYHSDLKGYLSKCTSLGISLIKPEGYNMVSEVFPETNKPLCETVTLGMRDNFWDKPEVFNPNKIRKINFAPGRHTAKPKGRIRTPRNVKVKLLHYKYIGINYLLHRHHELRSGLRPLDIKNDYGNQYLWNDEKNIEEYNRIKANSISIV